VTPCAAFVGAARGRKGVRSWGQARTEGLFTIPVAIDL